MISPRSQCSTGPGRIVPFRSLRVVLILGLAWLIPPSWADAQTPPPRPRASEAVDRPVAALHDYAKWEKEIAAFEAADRENPPAPGGILFIGSSGIRLWKTLATDFAGLPVLNRGFGGSEIADSTHFADRIIFPYAPKQIFLRAGTNDLHAGLLPADVAGDFADFVRVVHGRLPRTEIIFIGGNSTPSRWNENDKVIALNKKIRRMARKLPRVAFIDAYDLALTPTGESRPELFVADRLHFNADGYKLLAERVRPYLPVPKKE